MHLLKWTLGPLSDAYLNRDLLCLAATLLHTTTSLDISIKPDQYFSFQLPTLTSLTGRKYCLLPAPQFSYNYWQLLNWNTILSHRIKGSPGIALPWNGLVFTFKQHCASHQILTIKYVFTSLVLTHFTCLNICSEASTLITANAVTH